MTMKKSLIAVAVAGAVGAPMSAAQAAAPEVYGFVNVGLESASVEDGGGAANAAGVSDFIIFQTPGDDSGLAMSDIAETRLGVRGTEDLGNGLTSGYRLEFGLGTSAFDEPGGSVEEDADFELRLANVSLSGDFGEVKVGTQWGTLYEYSGWNIFRSDGHGGAGWYWMTSLLDQDWFGLRVSSAATYTYGGGGYSSDPFTFSVQGVMNQTEAGTGDSGEIGDPSQPRSADLRNDEETLDALIIGGQGTFGDVTVNAVYNQENRTVGPEPSLISLGARWSNGPLYVGGSWLQMDRDNAAGNKPSVLIALAGYDFGGGVSGMAGFSTGDADTSNGTGDLSAFFLQAQRELSANTKVYAEYETATTDKTATGGEDGETSVVHVAIKHSF